MVIFGQAIGFYLVMATEFISNEEVESYYLNYLHSYSDYNWL